MTFHPFQRFLTDKKLSWIVKKLLVYFSCSFLISCHHLPNKEIKIGNVIFFHPDGMSLSHWDMGRIITVGPDGLSSWDKLPYMAVYKTHLKNNLVASSNAGATVHAYGVKVPYSSFGTNGGDVFRHPSLLKEAQQRGLRTGLCQSGVLVEPGTAVFASSAKSRKDFSSITQQLIHSDVTILLGGGEKYLLPKNVQGRFGLGTRTDGKNLIKKAEKNGYLVIYTLEELKNIPLSAKKVLGVFAYENTYNDETEEVLKKKGLKAYEDEAPTIAQMAEYSLEFLSRDKNKKFFLVVEEEGTDNFSNKNNAKGLFEAISRSLDTITFLRGFLNTNKDTLLVVASDSNASSPALIDRFHSKNLFTLNKKISDKSDNSAPMDRKDSGYPFASVRDKNGLSMPFSIVWPTKHDTGTGVLIKGEGFKAHQIKGTLDNTDVYKIMRQTLFGF